MKNIAPDKWKHFYVGIGLGVVFHLILYWLLPNNLLAIISVNLLLVTAIGFGFELFSKVTGLGHHEVMDAIATVIGGVVGLLAVLVFLH